MIEYGELLAGVERLEKMGGLQEALDLLQKMKQVFPDRENEIVLRMLKIMFQQERYEETLDVAVEYIPNDDGNIFQWLLQMYYDPFREESENIKKHNMECLEQYAYFYDAEDKNNIKALLYDGCEKLIFCGEQTIGRYVGTPEIELKNDEIALISNVLNIPCLAEQISKTKYDGELSNCEIPVYLYYDEDIFHALIQCVEMKDLLNDNRVVVLVGEDQLKQFFGERQVQFPDKIIGTGIERIKGILDDQLQVKMEKLHNDKTQIEEYYRSAKEDIDERIRQQKPRILFLTSYFTTALKYHTRDMSGSAEKIGLDTRILMERGTFFRIFDFDFYDAVNSFRPDIIFCIDHFRFEYYEIPKEIVWICWVQDPMPYIMDKNTPAKLGKRDFVLNQFITWEKIKNVGYAPTFLIDAPIPSNQEIYKPYKLTIDEQRQYGCDICFVCHASDVDVYIKEVAGRFSEEIQDAIISVYKGYQQYVYETGSFFYQREVFREYIRGAMLQHYGIRLVDSCLDFLSEDMQWWFNMRVYREILADWIIDAGFQNVKLWGNGWKKNPKYEPYAMGPAQNGEILSKIYQSSKIVVGNNVLMTGPARVWETMLSGGFYLSNFIPEEADAEDIRKILKVDKDVIMFYDKADLIEKLHYYLEHEEERKIIAERGRKAALEKMTFDSLLKRMLKEIAIRL